LVLKESSLLEIHVIGNLEAIWSLKNWQAAGVECRRSGFSNGTASPFPWKAVTFLEISWFKNPLGSGTRSGKEPKILAAWQELTAGDAAAKQNSLFFTLGKSYFYETLVGSRTRLG
jgi:hypothetical protein